MVYQVNIFSPFISESIWLFPSCFYLYKSQIRYKMVFCGDIWAATIEVFTFQCQQSLIIYFFWGGEGVIFSILKPLSPRHNIASLFGMSVDIFMANLFDTLHSLVPSIQIFITKTHYAMSMQPSRHHSLHFPFVRRKFHSAFFSKEMLLCGTDFCMDVYPPTPPPLQF